MRELFISTALAAVSLTMTAGPVEKTDTLRSSVVTGTRVTMLRDQVPSQITVIGGETISATLENTVLPALAEKVPGLFITSRGVTGYGVSSGGTGAISLRGFGADAGRVLILIDGHPQFESIYGHPVADEYLAANAGKIEVSRGAASVLYGSNAMGGAINILTRKPVRDGNELGVKVMGGSFGTFRGQLTDSYKKDRFSSSVSFSYDRTDGHRDNSAFNSIGGMANAAYDLGRAWKAGARFSLVDAESQNPGPVSAPILEGTANTIRGMAGMSLENEYDNTSGSVDLYYNWGNHIINDGHTAERPPQEYLFHGTDFTAGLTAHQTARLFKGNRLTAGVDLLHYGGNAYRNPQTEIYADHKKLDEQAIYLFDNQELGRFLLSAGLRMDHHSAYGVEWLPHLGLSWRPDDLGFVKASVSKGFRMPNMRELYMYAVANEDLLPEQAWSYDLGIGRHFLDGALNLEAGVYYTKGDNIIEVTVADGVRQNRNAGSFENYGVEFSADWRITPTLSAEGNYSYLHMAKILTGAPVHKGWAGLCWTPGRFSARIGAMWISDLYLAAGDAPQKQSYTDIKASAAYKITDKISVFVRGTNLLGKSYETLAGFPEPGATFLGGVSLDITSSR
ncbi:MAG: TonB-dependent receptor [Bacteroidales bacterium]|nr:TonB-dependent receptor [Bacteroidales bacterium]